MNNRSDIKKATHLSQPFRSHVSHCNSLFAAIASVQFHHPPSTIHNPPLTISSQYNFSTVPVKTAVFMRSGVMSRNSLSQAICLMLPGTTMTSPDSICLFSVLKAVNSQRSFLLLNSTNPRGSMTVLPSTLMANVSDSSAL